MGIEYTVSEENGYLRFIVHGTPESAKEMVNYIRGVRFVAMETDAAKVLIDETYARIPFERIKDLVKSTEVGRVENGKAGFRVAVLCAPGSIDTFRFFEPFLVNSTFEIQAFEYKAEAVEWLLSPDASCPHDNKPTIRG